MTVALHDPNNGYYATHDPIGARGDFITAPEISQMFGELIGLWCVQAWRDQGCPAAARLVELGPGRGTLMSDALRAARTDPQFLSSIEVTLVETSPVLRTAQAERLKDSVLSTEEEHQDDLHKPMLRWATRFDDSLADRPLFLIANEFFDALPIRQFMKTERGWCERMVTVNEQGDLSLAVSPTAVPLNLPPSRGPAQPGALYEFSPAAEALAEGIAAAIAEHGGAALLVDYGYGADAGFGETFQALSQHRFANALHNPGESDLSAHVDFGALARAVERGGATAHGPIGQGEFLRNLGIVERAAQLSAGHAQIAPELDRLTASGQMGTLFKALAILPKNTLKPLGF